MAGKTFPGRDVSLKVLTPKSRLIVIITLNSGSPVVKNIFLPSVDHMVLCPGFSIQSF